MANTKVTGDLIASLTIATGNIANNAITSDKISGLTTAHITEGANLYYTDARARAAVSVSGNALSYNSSTGVITSNFEESPTFTGNVLSSGLTVSSALEAGNSLINTKNLNTGGTGTEQFYVAHSGSNLLLGNARGNLIFGTGSNKTTALTIDTSQNATFAGNVGIGSAPAGNPGTQILSVGTPATTAGGIQLWAANNNTHYLQFGDANSGGEVYRGGIGYAHSTDSLLLLQGSATALSFTGSQAATFAGTVLIDGLSNYTGLTVKGAGASRPAILFENVNQGSLGMIYATEGDAIVINTGSDAVTINSSGQVGIGTTTPETNAKLDVRAGSGGKIVLGSYDANYKVVVEGGDQLNFYNGASAATAYMNYGFTGTPGNILLSRNLFVEANSSGGTSGTVRIKSDGKVGIGTTSPSEMLHINGGGNGPEIRLQGTWGSHYIRAYNDNWNFLVGGTVSAISIQNSGDVTFAGEITSGDDVNTGGKLVCANMASDKKIAFRRTGANNFSIEHDSSSLYFYNESTSELPIRFFNNGDVSMIAGNVAIGTTSPGGNLEIKTLVGGSGVNTLRLNTNFSGGNTVDINPFISGVNNGGMEIKLAGSQKLVILPSGNVGIGTTSPSQPLEIGGIASPALKFTSTGTNGGVMIFNVAGTDKGFFGSGYHLGTGSSNDTVMRGEADLVFSSGGNNQRMRVTASGKTLIGITSEQTAGRLQIDSGTSSNGGILDIANGGWYRYYTRVCRNATAVSAAGYWHIKTNIVVNSNVMFMAKFYGYIYGSSQILDLTHTGYAYSGSNTVINQATTNNGSDPNASSAIYSSTTGNKVTFRIAFGTGSNFSTYFAGVMMDMAFPSPAGQDHNLEIEAQSFSTSTTVY